MAVVGVDDGGVGCPQRVFAEVPLGGPVQGVDGDAGELSHAGGAVVARLGEDCGVEVAAVLQGGQARGGAAGGMVGANGVRLATAVVDRFEVGDGSVLRLQQLLSLLGYSPLAWTPSGPAIPPADAAAQAAAAFTPPPGAFTWRQAGWPAELISRWTPGVNGTLTKGLVMAFEADHGLSPDGVAGSQVWAAVLQAVAAHQLSTGGYTYAVASKAQPENLTIWHDGQQVLHSPANTGISQAPTVDGTFPVYERLRSQVMKGTNPDGSSYADPVQYVAYFNGGDAVHYIPRSSFGSPQSLGCVELPLSVAAQAWPYLAVGSLVTVSG